jgi:phosphoglycolate phosphatase-like HAD superfamily hydrolase
MSPPATYRCARDVHRSGRARGRRPRWGFASVGPSPPQDSSGPLDGAALAFQERWAGRTPAFLFDVDGTLVEFGVDYERLRALVREHLESQRVAVSSGLRPLLEGIEDSIEGSHHIPHRDRVIIREGAYDLVDEAERRAARTATAVEGAGELLSELARRGLRVGLCTRNEPVSVRVAFERLGLPLPEVVVGRGDVPYAGLKPDPRHPLEALRRLEVAADDAMLVGNTALDVRAGRSAGLWTVLVGTGAPGPGPGSAPGKWSGRMVDVEPDLRVGSLVGLTALVRGL